ncbi:MAG: glycosyltransferase family 2 protein [Candidatus Altiarchaeota archaeon]|nr:glycosyltransferase family 2 protein [Candidatus Altiarchaeota archaeon]
MDFALIRLLAFAFTSFVFIFVSIFWLLVLLDGRKEVYNDPPARRKLSLAVIVPAFNEGDVIADCLRSLLKLDYPELRRIVVIDDGSTDDTSHVVSGFLPHPKITLVIKENGGKASAMNEGLKHVEEELVACLDADSVIVKPDILNHMVGYFDNPKVAAVTPSMKVYRPANVLQQVQWIEYLLGQFLRKMSSFLDVILVAPGPFTIYRASVLREIGGFDSSTLTEDMEIAYRIHKYGYSIQNSSNAEVGTNAPVTLHQLFRQRLRWSRGTYQNIRKYIHFLFNRSYGTIGLVIFPLSVLTLLMIPLLVPYSAYLLGLGAYQRAESLYYNAVMGIRPEFAVDYVTSFFGMNFFATFLAVLMLSLALVLLVTSHRYTHEKINPNMKAAYAVYLFGFYFLLNVIFLTALAFETIGVRRRW